MNEVDIIYQVNIFVCIICITSLSLTADSMVASLIAAGSHTFVKIDHEIISTVIILFPLIQEGLLSVTSESMRTKYWLTAYSSLPRKRVIR